MRVYQAAAIAERNGTTQTIEQGLMAIIKNERTAFLKKLQGHCNPLGLDFGQGFSNDGQWGAYAWVKDDKTVLFDGSESNEQIKMAIREGMAT